MCEAWEELGRREVANKSVCWMVRNLVQVPSVRAHPRIRQLVGASGCSRKVGAPRDNHGCDSINARNTRNNPWRPRPASDSRHVVGPSLDLESAQDVIVLAIRNAKYVL